MAKSFGPNKPSCFGACFTGRTTGDLIWIFGTKLSSSLQRQNVALSLDRFQIGNKALEPLSSDLLICWLPGREQVAPDWHFARAVGGKVCPSADNGFDLLLWEAAAVLLGEDRKVGGCDLKRAGCWTVAFPIFTVTGAADLLPKTCTTENVSLIGKEGEQNAWYQTH